MGREVRKVPPDWQHPKDKKGNYIPCYDQDYTSACKKWYEGVMDFVPNEDYKWYHEYAGDPPDEERYRSRKWIKTEATHFQLYENVSEGTPVTPIFSTKEELINYLVKNGTYWDMGRGWNRESAERTVKDEYCPSMIMRDGKILLPGEM